MRFFRKLLPLLLLAAPVFGQSFIGLIDPTRASSGTGGSGTNGWAQVGVLTGNPVTGALPSDVFTPCTTIQSYNGNTDTINNAIAGCGNNTYVLLATGTFNLTSGGAHAGIVIFKSNVELRAAHNNTTTLNFASGAHQSCAGGGVNANICIADGSGLDIGVFGPPDYPPVPVTGFSQGSNTLNVTVFGSYTAGTSYTPGQVVSFNGKLFVCQISCTNSTPSLTTIEWGPLLVGSTLIGIDECSWGNTGTSCTSNPEVDNGNFFDCDVKWNGTAGCADNGPDAGNQRLNRPQNELYQLTAVNVATGALTINGSIKIPIWNASWNPEIFVIPHVIQNSGVRNLHVVSGGSGAAHGIALAFSANSWITGSEVDNVSNTAFELYLSAHDTIQFNYCFGTTSPGGTDSWCYKTTGGTDNLWQSNIGQRTEVLTASEGADTGSVWGYNFGISSLATATGNGNFIYPQSFQHAGDRYGLYEGSWLDSIYQENLHGPKIAYTIFRCFIPAWESCANNPGMCGTATFKSANFANQQTGFTTAIRLVHQSRFNNILFNVLGTPSVHGAYQTTTQALADGFIYEIGTHNLAPFDPIVGQTTYRYGNYDTVTGGTRFCLNSSSTNWAAFCNNTSEVPTTFSPYGQPAPTVGDTGNGQTAPPASLYLVSKPSWFGPLTWPPVHPESTGGAVGQCSGTFGPSTPNVSGQFGGLASPSASKCTGTTLLTPAWGGHLDLIPAANCFFNIMNGPLDGSNTTPLSFDADTCYKFSLAPPTNLKVTPNVTVENYLLGWDYGF